MPFEHVSLVVMAKNSNMTTHYRYIHEVVWLPTYLVIALVVLGTVQNSAAVSVALFFSLVACRMVLELLYRIAFGDERLTTRIGLLAFGSQLVVWGLLLHWFLEDLPTS